MKEIIQGFYQKKHFWTRLILVIAAVILMGFALSWLLLVDLGTDPCTLLNQTISTRLGISIGNWQALFNTVLLIFDIIRKITEAGTENQCDFRLEIDLGAEALVAFHQFFL